MNNEIEVLEQFFAALNRNDMHGIPTYFDPQIVRIEPEGFPTAGTYRGIAEVQAHMTKGQSGTGGGSSLERPHPHQAHMRASVSLLVVVIHEVFYDFSRVTPPR